MNLDAEFQKALVELSKKLVDSKYIEGFAQTMVDDHEKYGEEPEDMIGDFDAINEDCREICNDYIASIVHDKPDEVWAALCNDLTQETMMVYLGRDHAKQLIKKYYGKPYDYALDNNDEGFLSYICEALLTQVYMYEQGGWYDSVEGVYVDAILNAYDKIVGN